MSFIPWSWKPLVEDGAGRPAKYGRSYSPCPSSSAGKRPSRPSAPPRPVAGRSILACCRPGLRLNDWPLGHMVLLASHRRAPPPPCFPTLPASFQAAPAPCPARDCAIPATPALRVPALDHTRPYRTVRAAGPCRRHRHGVFSHCASATATQCATGTSAAPRPTTPRPGATLGTAVPSTSGAPAVRCTTATAAAPCRPRRDRPRRRSDGPGCIFFSCPVATPPSPPCPQLSGGF